MPKRYDTYEPVLSASLAASAQQVGAMKHTCGRAGRLQSFIQCLWQACLWTVFASSLAHAQLPPATDANPAAVRTAATDAMVADSTGGHMAQLSSAEIAARYPANTIDSVARATAAIDDVTRARKQVETQLAGDERACVPAFFTTRCLDQARERRHIALARLRPIEVEANTYKRRARVDERDRALEQKQTKAEPVATTREAKAPKPESSQRVPGDETRVPATQSVGTSAESGAGRSNAATHAAGRSTPHHARSAAPAIDGATEEANMAAFDRKAKESAKRQAEIAAKKAEKEQDRARKKAAASVVAPPTPGASRPD